jgi:hypothetical protein
MRLKSHFRVVAEMPDVIAIEDLDTGMSVTNEAEGVVAYLAQLNLGNRRLLYLDSDGYWDELKHDGQGHFTGFGLIGTPVLQKALASVRA